MLLSCKSAEWYQGPQSFLHELSQFRLRKTQIKTWLTYSDRPAESQPPLQAAHERACTCILPSLSSWLARFPSKMKGINFTHYKRNKGWRPCFFLLLNFLPKTSPWTTGTASFLKCVQIDRSGNEIWIHTFSHSYSVNLEITWEFLKYAEHLLKMCIQVPPPYLKHLIEGFLRNPHCVPLCPRTVNWLKSHCVRFTAALEYGFVMNWFCLRSHLRYIIYFLEYQNQHLKEFSVRKDDANRGQLITVTQSLLI